MCIRDREKKFLTPGENFRVFKINGLKIGLMICADVLFMESFQFYNVHKVDIIFVPTTSSYKEEDTPETKLKRDEEIWLKGAKIADCYIIKVSGVGKILGRKILGRSLVASPEKIIFRNNTDGEKQEKIISINLNLNTQNKKKK